MKPVAMHFWRTREHWGFWIRIFGAGIAVSTMQPCFSERVGRERHSFRFMGVKVKVLKREWP